MRNFGPREVREAPAMDIDDTLRELASRAHARAFEILQENRRVLEESAEHLLEEEVLEEEELEGIFERLEPRSAPGAT